MLPGNYQFHEAELVYMKSLTPTAHTFADKSTHRVLIGDLVLCQFEHTKSILKKCKECLMINFLSARRASDICATVVNAQNPLGNSNLLIK